MAIFCFVIPFITCLILFIWFRQVTVWWEYIAIVFPSALITFILYVSFKHYVTLDTEYLGYYVTKVRYYEPWDEYIHKTCEREVNDGTDSDGNAIYRTETYDCSYVDYHPAEWTMIHNGSTRETNISQEGYNKIKNKFGTPLVFIDMHRHYHTQDGDCYECCFNGDRNRMWALTKSHSYKNKILGSKSLFNFSEVSEAIKKEYKLYDYPDFNYINSQNPIMSEIAISRAVIDSFKYINAYYGSKYQFRIYVMIWKNALFETSTYQQDYFIGGNKNELCICISVDNNGYIQWVNAFSWEDKPELRVGVNHLFEKGERLDLMKLNRYLLTEVPQKWKRKAFKDFDYINISLSSRQWVMILIITLIYNIVIALIVINNEYTYNNTTMHNIMF